MKVYNTKQDYTNSVGSDDGDTSLRDSLSSYAAPHKTHGECNYENRINRLSAKLSGLQGGLQKDRNLKLTNLYEQMEMLESAVHNQGKTVQTNLAKVTQQLSEYNMRLAEVNGKIEAQERQNEKKITSLRATCETKFQAEMAARETYEAQLTDILEEKCNKIQLDITKKQSDIIHDFDVFKERAQSLIDDVRDDVRAQLASREKGEQNLTADVG